MSIQPIDNTACNFDFYAYPNALTADALMIYCRSQLNSIDGDIKCYLDEQRLNLARKKALSDVENTMKKYTEVLTPAGQAECWKTWQDSINSLPPGDPVRAQMEAKFGEMLQPRERFSKEEWAGFIGDVHSILEDVNGGAEIKMIELQSMMSQRQTVVQLTTNLFSKFDEGTKSIVSNIGR